MRRVFLAGEPELHRARNFKPWMSKGLYLGSLMVGSADAVAADTGLSFWLGVALDHNRAATG